MCKELLRVQQKSKKANFKFILGHPSLRPTWTAEHKAAFSLLLEDAGYDKVPAFLKKIGLQTLLEFRVPLPLLLQLGLDSEALAQRHDAKTLFLTAMEGNIDVKVLPTTHRQTKP
jgi:hypothetical protein